MQTAGRRTPQIRWVGEAAIAQLLVFLQKRNINLGPSKMQFKSAGAARLSIEKATSCVCTGQTRACKDWDEQAPHQRFGSVSALSPRSRGSRSSTAIRLRPPSAHSHFLVEAKAKPLHSNKHPSEFQALSSKKLEPCQVNALPPAVDVDDSTVHSPPPKTSRCTDFC